MHGAHEAMIRPAQAEQARCSDPTTGEPASETEPPSFPRTHTEDPMDLLDALIMITENQRRILEADERFRAFLSRYPWRKHTALSPPSHNTSPRITNVECNSTSYHRPCRS